MSDNGAAIERAKKGSEAEKVRFFNISLINANVMSLPKFPQPQRLMGELIHSIEASSPTFAWVQFLFKRVNLSPTLIALKNSIHAAQEQIKTPKRSWMDDSEYDRSELYRDWYKRSGERVKRLDAIANTPHVLLAIQGMWVGDPRQLTTLPFKDCYDEFDRLGTFVYKNPWMLVELVERRMVEDISPYFMSYARSRMEPPSFLITPEEIPYLIHFPIVKGAKSMKSVDFTQYSPLLELGGIEGSAGEETDGGNATVSRLTKIPLIKEPLEKQGMERLSLLSSPTVRGFEIMFTPGKTNFVISSHSVSDLSRYLTVLKSVYGELSVVSEDPKPAFLAEIPNLVGLKPSHA